MPNHCLDGADKPVLNNGIFYQPSTIRQEQIQEPKTPVQKLEVLAEGWECEIHVSSNKNNNKQQTASNNQQATGNKQQQQQQQMQIQTV